jgi:hypothetical protein
MVVELGHGGGFLCGKAEMPLFLAQLKSQPGDDRDQPGNAIGNQECDDLRALVSEQSEIDGHAGYENRSAPDQSETETADSVVHPPPPAVNEMQTSYPWTKKEDGIAGGDSCYFQQMATARY